MTYQLIDRMFSRLWRRNKRYSERELRWLAKKRGLSTRLKRDTLEVFNPASQQVIVRFQGKGEDVTVKPFGKLAQP